MRPSFLSDADRAQSAIGPACVLGLLTYPLPTAWAGLVGLLVLARLRWQRSRRPFPRTRLNFAIGLYMLGAVIGLYVSVRPGTGEVRFFGLVAAIATFFLIVDQLKSPQRARDFLVATLVAILLVLPILFVIVAPTLNVERLPGAPRDAVNRLVPLGEVLRPLFGSEEQAPQRFRLRSSSIAALGTLGVALALGFALAGGSRRERLLGWVAIAICSVFLLLAANRGAILIGSAVVALFVSMRLGGWRLVTAMLLMAASFLLAFGSLNSGLRAGALDALGLPERVWDVGPVLVRFEMWGNSLAMMSDFRFTGIGLGLSSVREVYERQFMPIDPRFHHAHNVFVQSYLEQGPLGLVGGLGLLTSGLATGWSTLKQSRNGSGLLGFSASAAPLVLGLGGLTEVVALTTTGMILLFGSLGLLVAVNRLSPRLNRLVDPATRQPTRPQGWPGLLGPSAAALLLCAPFLALSAMAAPVADGAAPVGIVRSTAFAFYLNMGALKLAQAAGNEDLSRADRRERLQEARDLLLRARELDRNALNVYIHLAAAELAGSGRPEANSLLQEAAGRAAPGEDRLFFQLGRVHRSASDLEGAIASWSRVGPSLGAWSCAGSNSQLIRWAREQDAAARWQSSIRLYQASINIAPDDPRPYQGLARAAAATEGLQSAAARMDRLAETNPNFPWPHVAQADLYEAEGFPREAAVARANANSVYRSEGWAAIRQAEGRVRRCP